MNLQDTVEFVCPEVFGYGSADVETIRTRHRSLKDKLKGKLKAATGDAQQRERSQTRRMERTMKYPTMSPGKGATLMPSNYGRQGTGRTPGGRMGSMNYSADFMGPGAVSVPQVGRTKRVSADASSSDIAHHNSMGKEPSATDQEEIKWRRKRTQERAVGRNLEVYEFLSVPHA